MRLDLADLRLFIAIVDTGSITGGAANAHLALASASERLRKMEAEFDRERVVDRYAGQIRRASVVIKKEAGSECPRY